MADEPGVEDLLEIGPAMGPLVGQAPQPDPIGHRARPGIGPASRSCGWHATIVARSPDGPTAPQPLTARRRTTRSTRHHEGEHRSPRSVTP